MNLLKIYLVIILPVVVVIFMVYINFYIKKQIKELKKRNARENDYIVKESEKVLFEYLKLSREGDLADDKYSRMQKSEKESK
ncbi:hypothetical protein BBF96_14260 [Anoxybacter fermentans]|uniref:Uncharacterized protein n=1 Tax=Anoxybacter fermentans TaxID=1323375 RepID=A0A3Q9HS11_9FIRM|nr:hypothetical protein [Anoxybacter fermentans]AZR74448.1 hypothetical protein BBF96_14260 [Anoxybacter fermentans]